MLVINPPTRHRSVTTWAPSGQVPHSNKQLPKEAALIQQNRNVLVRGYLLHMQLGDVADRASLYYFLMVCVVIGYKTKATARRTLTFIVRIFVNDTIAIAVWASFRANAVWRSFHVCLCT